MTICTVCGRENRADARFCDRCGTQLFAPSPERRKLATLLFCDLAGSTTLGEQADAEAVHELIGRYFEAMRAAIERHGGTVEKFVGDAVMAVFGVPVAHEDDPVRACRAALEMRARVEELELRCRIGVNTGEVLAADASGRQTFVTGDAVNTAARLEQAARLGEILLGEETVRLCGQSADTEAVPAVVAKGKRAPVHAARLLSVTGLRAVRGLETPLVGRGEELALLLAAFEEAVSSRSCRLVTVIGEPGVGKSRLAAELEATVEGGAQVLRGRCLSYGEGITYWPLAEIVRALRRITDPDSVMEARAKVDDPAIAAAIGLGGHAAADEIAVAFRKLFESLAQERPLVVLVEDVHWAEETLLELLAFVEERASGPILLLLTARPEFEQFRATLELEPLAEEETRRLLERTALDAEQRARVARDCGGNPLFAEELAAFLAERPDATEVPPSLGALLTARLDLLPEHERAAAERASVEGEIFHRGSVEALSTNGNVAAAIEGLVERALIRPANAELADEAAYRFKHLLVRDAAYSGTPKRLRAELHERFAGWLEATSHSRRTEVEEILGYHLEQAYRYRQELGFIDGNASELAERASELLARAGRRALEGDARAARNLLGRALELQVPGRRDIEVEFGLAEALTEVGKNDEALSTCAEAAERAAEAGDRVAELRARILFCHLQGVRGMDRLPALTDEALPLFERAGDDAALETLWSGRGMPDLHTLRYGEYLAAQERALMHARRAGNDHRARALTMGTLYASVYGPTPVAKTLRRFEEHRSLERSFPQLTGYRALLQAMCGRFDDARALLADSNALLHELGREPLVVMNAFNAALIEMLAGDPAAAEREARSGCELLEAMGDSDVRSSLACHLGDALYALGRYDEADEWAGTGKQLAARDDAATQILWRYVRAKVLARREEHADAERLARKAVALAADTDALNLYGDALSALAEVHALAGSREQAAEARAQALALYERKGNIPSARVTRCLLEEAQVVGS